MLWICRQDSILQALLEQQRNVRNLVSRRTRLAAFGRSVELESPTGPMVRDPHSGKYRRMRLFVLTLGYSRKSIRLLVFQSSTQTWAELHEQAFRRLGGCTRVVVLDNLGEGVLKPDIYDPTLNPVYADMLRHYGVVAMPCRVADPDRNAAGEPEALVMEQLRCLHR